MRTERVTFLTSPDHKAALDAYAARTNQSVGHVVREATNRFIAEEQESETELAALVAEVNAAMPKMRASLDTMIEALQRTHEHVDRTLREAGIRK